MQSPKDKAPTVPSDFELSDDDLNLLDNLFDGMDDDEIAAWVRENAPIESPEQW